MIVDLGASPIVTHAGYDFVYYERFTFAVPGIYMDSVVVEVCADAPCFVSHIVFDWGDGFVDNNTNIGAAGYSSGRAGQRAHPRNGDLYGTPPYQVGIAIDVDAVAPAGTYGYVRLSAPAAGGTVTDGAEVDAIELLPDPATATPTPSATPTATPTATAVTGTTVWLYDDASPSRT